MNKKIKCILLIDDDASTNEYNTIVLEETGCAEHVISFTRASEGLDFVNSNPPLTPLHPEIIFLDINMPLMDGWDFLEEHNKLTSEKRKNTIVVMLTTSANISDELKAKEKGAAFYFIKPLSEEILHEIINIQFPE